MIGFNVVDLFCLRAREMPGRTALIWQDKSVTFGDFEQSIIETAGYFLSKGIKKGDRVMVFVPMSGNLYRIVLALFRIGAVAVFLDEWVSIKRLNDCCRLAQCSIFIGTWKGSVIAWFVPGLRKIPLHLGLHYDRIDTPAPFPETERDDVALITFTTGSTGTPKAAIRTHGLLYEQFQALTPLLKPSPEDVCLPVLPIVLLINLGAGVTSVIADYKVSRPASLKPAKIVAQIEKHQINSIIASPFFVRKLGGYLLDEKRVTGVKKVFTGGAPVFPSEARVYSEAFPDAEVQIVYGSTEAEPISAIGVEELLDRDENALFKGLKVGQPEESAQVKIIGITDADISVSTDEALDNMRLPPGEIGEIIVSGRHVLRDYLHNAEALKRNKIFIGTTCWHRTGDSGYQDEKGSLYLTGRCSSLIRSGGALISSFVYENHFQSMSGVEAGTILLQNDKLTAVVELKAASRKEDVLTAIKALPILSEDIVFLSKIPRDPRHNSKIDYEKLREILHRKH